MKMPRFQLAHLGSVFKDQSMELFMGVLGRREISYVCFFYNPHSSCSILISPGFLGFVGSARRDQRPDLVASTFPSFCSRYFKECWILLSAGFMEAEGIRVEGIVAVPGCRIVAGDVQQ